MKTFEPSSKGDQMPDLTEELLVALDHMFLSMVKLDLDEGTAVLLQSLGQRERGAYEFEWERYLDFYRAILEPDEAVKLSEVLSVAHLRKIGEADGTSRYQVEFSCRSEAELEWLEIVVYFMKTMEGSRVAYILTLRNGQNHLLRSIIDLYVYSKCDYFIYLDAKNNSYIMFSGSDSGTPLPPTTCDNYSREIVEYAEHFVVPEDREMVVREMQLERVLSVLERKDIHAFTCGVWQEGVGYTYKRLEYRYYNRSRQMILLSRTDITDLYNEKKGHAKELKEARKRAQMDPLTGLLNYQGIQKIVRRALERADQISALLFLDLDDFKKINDTHGHIAGNYALQKVAEVLNQNIRVTDYAARIGGDEFVVFLENIHDVDYAAGCARRLCTQLSQICLPDTDMKISGSIGVAIAPEDGTDYESLVKKADSKVYQAKFDGKNQFAL